MRSTFKVKNIFDSNMNYDAPLKAEMALSPVMMRTLFILIMFAIHCVGDLCSPIARNRCCDPQVFEYKVSTYYVSLSMQCSMCVIVSPISYHFRGMVSDTSKMISTKTTARALRWTISARN